jgi:hypothetical protein
MVSCVFSKEFTTGQRNIVQQDLNPEHAFVFSDNHSAICQFLSKCINYSYN